MGGLLDITACLIFEQESLRSGVRVEALRPLHYLFPTGVFGADMQVSLVNDGPVTIAIDSRNPE